MAALFFQTRTRTVSPATQGIGEINRLYENELRRLGYADVVRTPSEVAGNKNGCRLSIVHLPIAGANFYEVFMVAGDTVPAAQGVLGEAVAIVFHFL
ncbi:hypothetical protein [Limnoglobus roseus]|uniref:Uncharacterized protein n=1 Tax=Limnoglobus roseus TaxID=2598579 RepID=A0A5C1AEG6_9BACT|nr:hypothetical protein [Limnoglobus roseus]QEL16446.1 hypothetical protein PX52LOC_03400 [Limnoglobus roseus]